jgi:hypothetical protein
MGAAKSTPRWGRITFRIGCRRACVNRELIRVKRSGERRKAFRMGRPSGM